jgi:hypothetical protein
MEQALLPAHHPLDRPGRRERDGGDDAFKWVGDRVDDVHGARIGTLEAILVDRERGNPQWMLLRTSRIGHYHCAPLTRAAAGNGHVWLPHRRSTVMSGPRVTSADQRLSARMEQRLCVLFDQPRTRGAALSPWERRATSSRAWVDRLSGDVMWLPGPRGPSGERRRSEDRPGRVA